MTTLTKTFVVLLVLFSLLLTAATIVYVGKEDVRLTTLEQTQAQLAAARAEAQSAIAARQAAQANAQALQAQNNSLTTQQNEDLNAARADLAELSKRVVELEGERDRQEIQIGNLTEAAQASQTMAAALNDTLAQLRESADQSLQRSTELSARVSDLTNRLDVTERERRFLAEQLEQAQMQLAQANQVLRDNNISARTAGARAVPTPPINGVITDTRDIGGIPYATISVGSADDVQPGMQFRVVQGDQFLGTLTVDAVEPNEATGRLEGPRINQIQPQQTRVLTQLQ